MDELVEISNTNEQYVTAFESCPRFSRADIVRIVGIYYILPITTRKIKSTMNSKTTSGKSFSNSFNKSVNLEKSKRFPPLNYESYSVLDEESSLLFESEDFNHTLKHIIEQYGSFSQYVHQLSSPYNQTDIEGTVINTTSRANYIPVFNFPLSEVYSIVQENNTGSYLGPTAKIVIMVLYVTLIVVGTFGNVMVALIIVKRKEMRTAANIYVMNLTVSDITLCLICMPFTLAGLMVKNWKLGSLICKLVPVLQCTNILVSTATIVAIAGDRYMAIVRIGSRPRSKHCNQLSVAAIWAVSLVFPLPLFSYYFVEPVKIENILLYERCVEVWSSRKTQMTWTITLIVIQYVIPILVLIFVHIQIKNFLSRHQMSSLSATRKSQELERNRRTTILLTTIAGTFAVSWLPWHVVNLLADFHYFHSPEYFYAVFGSCHILAMSTACSNPVLYGWLNTNLRREMRALMTSFFKSVSIQHLCCVIIIDNK